MYANLCAKVSGEKFLLVNDMELYYMTFVNFISISTFKR